MSKRSKSAKTGRAIVRAGAGHYNLNQHWMIYEDRRTRRVRDRSARLRRAIADASD
jgi:hypothetical protein